jgi:hypothetical protein
VLNLSSNQVFPSNHLFFDFDTASFSPFSKTIYLLDIMVKWSLQPLVAKTANQQTTDAKFNY